MALHIMGRGPAVLCGKTGVPSVYARSVPHFRAANRMCPACLARAAENRPEDQPIVEEEDER